MRNMCSIDCYIAIVFYLSSFVLGIERDLYRCPYSVRSKPYIKTFGDQCYEFIHSERYQDEAQSDCKSRGGNLIQIQSSLTQHFVIYTLNALKWQRKGVWIGASDTDTEGTWRWVTGEKVLYSNWAEGQPSCGILFCNEHCAILRRDDGGQWHDKPCQSSMYHYSYICQYQMRNPTTTATTTTTTTTTSTTTTPTTTTMPTTTTTTTTTTSPTTTTTKSTTTPTTTTTTPTTTTTTTAATTPHRKLQFTTHILPSMDILKNTTSRIQIKNKTTPFNETYRYKHINVNNNVQSHNISKYVYRNRHLDISIKSNKISKANKQENGGDIMKSKWLIGGLIGGVAFLCLVLVFLVILYRKRRSENDPRAVYSVGFENPNYGQIKLRMGDDSLQPTMDDSPGDVTEHDAMIAFHPSNVNTMQNNDFGTFGDQRVDYVNSMQVRDSVNFADPRI